MGQCLEQAFPKAVYPYGQKNYENGLNQPKKCQLKLSGDYTLSQMDKIQKADSSKFNDVEQLER